MSEVKYCLTQVHALKRECLSSRLKKRTSGFRGPMIVRFRQVFGIIRFRYWQIWLFSRSADNIILFYWIKIDHALLKMIMIDSCGTVHLFKIFNQPGQNPLMQKTSSNIWIKNQKSSRSVLWRYGDNQTRTKISI